MLEKGGNISKQTQITSDGKFTRRETVENETDHLIPVLARLCEQDKSVQRAFFCSPKVRHICKMRREGGFCGYRNIQMMVSWLKKSGGFGHEHFPNKGPTILELQDMIESAWDMGFNSSGRVETGGIKDTRKFIGTPEVSLSVGVYYILCPNKYPGTSTFHEPRNSVSYLACFALISLTRSPDVKPGVCQREAIYGPVMLFTLMSPNISDQCVHQKTRQRSFRLISLRYTSSIKVQPPKYFCTYMSFSNLNQVTP